MNFRINAPSSVSNCSRRAMRCSSRRNSVAVVSRCARRSMGAAYQAFISMPIWPFGGRSRQKRQCSGRSRSSSDGSP